METLSFMWGSPACYWNPTHDLKNRERNKPNSPLLLSPHDDINQTMMMMMNGALIHFKKKKKKGMIMLLYHAKIPHNSSNSNPTLTFYCWFLLWGFFVIDLASRTSDSCFFSTLQKLPKYHLVLDNPCRQLFLYIYLISNLYRGVVSDWGGNWFQGKEVLVLSQSF